MNTYLMCSRFFAADMRTTDCDDRQRKVTGILEVTNIPVEAAENLEWFIAGEGRLNHARDLLDHLLACHGIYGTLDSIDFSGSPPTVADNSITFTEALRLLGLTPLEVAS